MDRIISARRETVLRAYEHAKAENYLRYLEGDDKATSEYIYENQIMDANYIVNAFYQNHRRVISITKKTKVGADGLMIEIAKILTTHSDDHFVVNLSNVRIITGMSNAGWEKDMIEKAPACFKDKIFHHGKLSRADLTNMRNGLIIIDEIDTGDKEFQVLHNTLKEAGVLDIHHMEANNNRFVFISATMIKELYHLYQWGELHELYKMTIPESYVGHIDFLRKNLIKEFYSLEDPKDAEMWVQEDILDYYGMEYRVHIVRVNQKTVDIVQNECIRKGIVFRNHTSTDRLTEEEIQEFFKEPLNNHIVLGVKGFFRRANLIPNRWKMRIGSTHELYTTRVDNNVQIQGLVGRMTGYWRDVIESGFKTGPHRTSMKAIEEYEESYHDPFGCISYSTSGFTKKNGKISTNEATMLSSHNIDGLVPIELPIMHHPCARKILIMNITEEDKRQIDEWTARKTKIREVLKIAKEKMKEVIELYKEYEPHFWNMDTEEKCEKWGYHKMKEDNSYSTTTNVHKEIRSNNVLMIYIHDLEVIFSPWNGERLIEV